MRDVGSSPAQQISELTARGTLHRERGQPALAEPVLREALALAETQCSKDSSRLVASLNALGLVCKDLAKYDDARACYERALLVLESTGAATPADVATLYHNLGGVEHARGNFAVGEPLARKGLELRRRIASAGDRELAADMVALAAILDGQGKFEEAESLYLEALQALEREPDENAHEIAVALNDLGANHARRGLLDGAEAMLTRAVELKTARLGAEHPEVALSLNNLGFVHERRGEIERAASLYAEAHRVFEQSLGHDHPKTRDCHRNYERARALNSRM